MCATRGTRLQPLTVPALTRGVFFDASPSSCFQEAKKKRTELVEKISIKIQAVFWVAVSPASTDRSLCCLLSEAVDDTSGSVPRTTTSHAMLTHLVKQWRAGHIGQRLAHRAGALTGGAWPEDSRAALHSHAGGASHHLSSSTTIIAGVGGHPVLHGHAKEGHGGQTREPVRTRCRSGYQHHHQYHQYPPPPPPPPPTTTTTTTTTQQQPTV